jgi:putative hydrolase of HD superfamily
MTDLDLLREALGLKELDRAGWLRVGIRHPESVAAHSFGTALAALVRCPAELDRARVVAMALVHDLAEVRVGDITPHDGVSRDEKKRREAEAAAALFVNHPALLALWHEAAEGQTPEARFVKACDLTDLALTARHYADRGFDTREFVDERVRDTLRDEP